MTFKSLFTMTAAGLWLALLPAGADVGPLQMFKGGGVVAPKSPHRAIRLDSQEVVIRLRESSYVVNAVFNLSNTGNTTREWIGFPKWVASRVESYPTFMRFEGSANGQELEFDEAWDLTGGQKLRRSMSGLEFMSLARRPMKEQRQWLVSHVTFPGHRMNTIRIRYEAPYSGKHFREAAYIYGTGSSWKDNIGRAVFVIDSSEVGGIEKISVRFVTGSGRRIDRKTVRTLGRPMLKNVMRYELSDFDPPQSARLAIKLNTGFSPVKNNYVRPPRTIADPRPNPHVSE